MVYYLKIVSIIIILVVISSVSGFYAGKKHGIGLPATKDQIQAEFGQQMIVWESIETQTSSATGYLILYSTSGSTKNPIYRIAFVKDQLLPGIYSSSIGPEKERVFMRLSDKPKLKEEPKEEKASQTKTRIRTHY